MFLASHPPQLFRRKVNKLCALRLEDCEQQVQIANLCYKFSLHERGLSADWKAEREARSPSHLQVDVWAFRKMAAALHADPLNRPSPKL